MASQDSTVLGVVLLVRHGDRSSFYQDPNTYTGSDTAVTPLGNVEEFLLGSQLRQLYLDPASASHIRGTDLGLFNSSQVLFRADAGDEGSVIYDSAISLAQGLWPNSTAYNTTLANGTNVVGPLGGYQYVPIESVESNDISLEGFADCNTFIASIADFYNSSEFAQKAAESQPFLNSLPPFLDGRPVTLQNMWNIFDFMNVNSIHNASFHDALPPTFLAQARDLANWHEYNTFTSAQLGGIENIAGRTVLPTLVNGMQRIVNASDPLALMISAISYKPFLSLFNMTGATTANASLAAVVDYAAAWALEVRQPAAGGAPVLRFNFKNGTDDVFRPYAFLGSSSDVPLATFINTLAPSGVNSTTQWCSVCANTQDRGCAALAAARGQGGGPSARVAAHAHQPIGPVGAGFLGAGLALVVAGAALGVLALLGVLTLGRRRRAPLAGRREKGADSDSA
ncbi:histidine phosphatase superfamily [Gloeopeniophorella convolvens]|nr:histidine phosphatase superfamily [Gloeopeniophorella convolvens]